MMIAPEVYVVLGQAMWVDIWKVQTKGKWWGRIAKACFSTLVVRKQVWIVKASTIEDGTITKDVKNPDKIVKEYIKM